jgi:hypothetical protein
MAEPFQFRLLRRSLRRESENSKRRDEVSSHVLRLRFKHKLLWCDRNVPDIAGLAVGFDCYLADAWR